MKINELIQIYINVFTKLLNNEELVILTMLNKKCRMIYINNKKLLIKKLRKFQLTEEIINNYNLSNWFLTNFVLDKTKKLIINKKYITSDPNVLNLLIKYNYEININYCYKAAKKGYIEIIKWFINNNYICDYTTILKNGIDNDKINIIKYIFENYKKYIDVDKMCDYALKKNNIDIFQYMCTYDGYRIINWIDKNNYEKEQVKIINGHLCISTIRKNT